MKRAAAMLVTGAFLFAVALPANAATTTVHMTSQFTFDPTPVSTDLGDTVMWTNDSSNDHTATSNQGFFNTGNVAQQKSKSKAFDFGGTFAYYCKWHGSPGHGMHGTIRVPDRWLNQGTQHVDDVQRIRIGTRQTPAGLALDVQIKRPDGSFETYRTKTSQAIVKFTPDAPGEFQFRSRLHRLSNNKVSGYSPPVFVEISS